MLHLIPDTGLYRPNPKSNLYSVAIHAGAILLLFAFASTKRIPSGIEKAIHLTDPILAPLTLPSHRGGGGGERMRLQAIKGVLPPRSNRQFVPPAALLNNLHPKLAIQPTIIAPPDAVVPQPVDRMETPLGKLGIRRPMAQAINGGIGSGKDGGVGVGRMGPGAGSGDSCVVVGSGVFSPGMGGVSAPVVIFQVEPQYSEEARKAKISGVVVLDLVVDPERTLCAQCPRNAQSGYGT